MFEPRPPLGLIPKFIRDEERLREIDAAVTRYVQALRPIPPEWTEERDALVAGLAARENGEWLAMAGRRVRTGVGTSLCVHGVGLSPGLWCGACNAEAWRREYAPDSTVACQDEGCNAMGPCAAHRTSDV